MLGHQVLICELHFHVLASGSGMVSLNNEPRFHQKIQELRTFVETQFASTAGINV